MQCNWAQRTYSEQETTPWVKQLLFPVLCKKGHKKTTQMINDSIIQKKYKFFLEHCKNSSSATFLEKKIKKRKVFAERVVKQTT